jgi:hypothetical protein
MNTILLSLVFLLAQIVSAPKPPDPILPLAPKTTQEVPDPSCVRDDSDSTWYFFASDDTIGHGKTCEQAHHDADRQPTPYYVTHTYAI